MRILKTRIVPIALLMLPLSVWSDNITFADANVKAICVTNWDTNGDGELSTNEAAAVTDLGTAFRNKTNITTFGELQYFTGLMSIGSETFYGCSGLTSVTIPKNVKTIGDNAFYGCTRLAAVVAEHLFPISIGSGDTFSNRSNSVLYVPKNSRLAYSSVDVWKDFKSIKYFPNPDVNRDGRVTIADATEIVNFILGKPSKGFVERLADIYEDGRITIADATAIVNLILYPRDYDESDGLGVDVNHKDYEPSTWNQGDKNVNVGKSDYDPGNWNEGGDNGVTTGKKDYEPEKWGN